MSGIDILPDSEALQIVSSVGDVLAAEFPLDRLRGGRLASLIPGQWQLAAEMGWFGLSLDVERGGVGLNIAEEMLVHREFGRVLASPSIAATAIMAHVAADRCDPEPNDYLTGRRHAAFAIEQGGDHYLIDAVGAAALVVVTPAGITVVCGDSSQNEAPVEAMDSTLPMTRSRLAVADGVPVTASATQRVVLLMAAQLSGIADAAALMATEYAKIRQQFGKPIGSFQAIAHACADAAMRGEAAHAQVLFAAIALRDGREDAAFQVACAARVAADAAFRNATMNIHTHGGMGYSAEADAHLYLKRTIVLRQLITPLSADFGTLLGRGAILE